MSQALRLEALPVAVLTKHLTGFDLLRLSHASPLLRRGHLDETSDVWTSHGALSPYCMRSWWAKRMRSNEDTSIPSASHNATAKARYFASLSFRFRDQEDASKSAGRIKVTMVPLRACKDHAFTVDLWFALSSGAEVCGTLLSMELKQLDNRSSTRRSRDIVRLDEYNNLYCSFFDDEIVVKTNLERQRWYHLAVTFRYDPETDTNTQQVYVDGELKLSKTSSEKTLLHSQSPYCIGRLVVGGTRSVVAFGGLIDDCRIWRSQLSPKHIQELKNCVEGDDWDGGSRLWSLKEAVKAAVRGKITLMQCTRPHERQCVSLRPKCVIQQDQT